MSRSARLFATILLSAVTAACSAMAGSTGEPSAAATPGVATPAAATPAPTPRSTPAASAIAAPSIAPSVAPGAFGGALPAALWGTWTLKGTTGRWVFTANRAASYNADQDGHTVLGVGVAGDELSQGPRLDDLTACQKIGLYRWKLVSPTELQITPIKQDPCPRGQALVHADFLFESPSTAPLS